jgi:predicted RNA-binding Zn ribbon-like protein
MQLRESPTTVYPSYRVARPTLLGGAPCLDFVNTVEWRGVPKPAERLTDYGEMLIWAEAAATIGRKTRGRLEAAAKRRPDAAAAALAEAIAFRETLAELLTADAPPPARVEELNAWLARAPERRRLAVSGEDFAWAAERGGDEFLAPVWPVVWSAADLLVSGQAVRVRSCADRRCAWLFLDTSRSRHRRWCSMEGCGNRAKARRHYRRQRAA